MNIIIIPRKRSKPVKLVLGPLSCAFAALAMVGVVAVASVGVYQYAHRHIVERELYTLQQVKSSAEAALGALTSRLSLLQSHVLRLDALGARLADMAQIDDIEFGADNPPGIGGPQPAQAATASALSDSGLLLAMGRLERALHDRGDKLAAMESMLMGRSLQNRTVPLGNPAQGGWVSSRFGYRSDPITGNREFHRGIDLAGRSGLPITSMASGIVTWSGPDQAYGNMIEISHGNGYVTRYAHNSRNLVAAGQRVERGEVIAMMGSTGRSTGAHVHFEVIKNGKHVDPSRYIPLQ